MQEMGIAEAADAVRRFFYRNEDELPEVVRSALAMHAGQGGSPVDLIVNFTEAMYANRKDVPQDGLAIAASCGHLIQREGYHTGLDGRARAMVPVLRRDSGERAPTGSPWPKKTDDPEPNPAFVAPQAAPAPLLEVMKRAEEQGT